MRHSPYSETQIKFLQLTVRQNLANLCDSWRNINLCFPIAKFDVSQNFIYFITQINIYSQTCDLTLEAKEKLIKKHTAMTRLKYLLPFLIVATFSFNCDCHQEVNAIVLDSKTRQPVDSVLAYKINKSTLPTFTDNKGKFKLQSISGGLNTHCPPMTVVLNKLGYQPKTIDIEVGAVQTVYLDKK